MYNSKKLIKNLTIVIIIISAVTLAVSVITMLRLIYEYKSSSDAYKTLKQFVTYNSSIPRTQSDADINDGSGLPTVDSTAGIGIPFLVDFDTLATVNPDITAWLYSEGTDIDYPVVQAQDNEYYLSHNFDKTLNRCGCLFIDAENASDFTDKNTIIYGHNMKDGSMFRVLMQYKTQAFYNTNPHMMLMLKEKTYRLELFAGYIAKPGDNAWQLAFADDSEFISWVETAREKSSFISDIDIYPEDKIVTLSTCTYEFNNARYIVIGKLTLTQ